MKRSRKDTGGRGSVKFVLASSLWLALAPAAMSCSSRALDDEETTDPVSQALAALKKYPSQASCAEEASPGHARCFAKLRADTNGNIVKEATPAGIGPAELHAAYNLPSSGGKGITVAIVDAQDDPNAESDLAVYRKQYGLPPCTTANGCFKKVNQKGEQKNYPTPDAGWAGEIALDLDMVSAVCPECKILLVEADNASMEDLGAAVNMAVQMGAAVVSNSYGGPEDNSINSASTSFFDHQGVLLTAATGDSGYGVSYPASAPQVLAVSGTSLVKAGGSARGGYGEAVWDGAGSGCSAFSGKQSWQKDTGCKFRTVGDVAAVADPNTGPAVYDSYGGGGGWMIVGGTSAASPIVAAIYALTGKTGESPSYAYSHTSAFYDVTAGNNGSCSPGYLCKAGVGYDGPSGVGTPNGAALAAGGSGPQPDGGVEDSGPSPDAGAPDSGTTPDAGAPDSGSGGSCSHDLCASGPALDHSCNSCVANVCANDSYCCVVAWDSTCVSEAKSSCGADICGGGSVDAGPGPSPDAGAPDAGGGGSCSHDICKTGKKLTSSCDACAEQICALDSYCCSNKWDQTCVDEVGSICGQSCN